MTFWTRLVGAACLLGAAAIAIASTILPLGAQEAATASTLGAVRARGYVVCGATDPLPGFAQQSVENRWSGFDVDFCRAVAAAVFNDPSKVEFRPLTGEARFSLLQTGAIDLIARNGAWTMRRDTGYGTRYLGAMFFDGQGFMVPQTLNVVSAYELDNVTICVLDEGDDLVNMREFFFLNQLSYDEVLYEDREDLRVAYGAGRCNAVSAPASFLHAVRRALPEPGAHRILPERISKEAFGPVVRDDDEQWAAIVRWTMFALINAEELGVTSANIEALSSTRTHAVRRFLGLEGDFGASIDLEPTFMKNVIGHVGNYGEMFDRHFGPGTGAPVLRGQNSLWTQGGLLFAPPVR